MGRMVDVALGTAGADPHGAARGIDAHAFHRREVDHEPIIAAAEARAVVAAATHRNKKVVVPAEIHRRDDVGDIEAPRNEQRALVDHGIVELPRVFVGRIAALDQGAA